jgi:hypothetical protein
LALTSKVEEEKRQKAGKFGQSFCGLSSWRIAYGILELFDI